MLRFLKWVGIAAICIVIIAGTYILIMDGSFIKGSKQNNYRMHESVISNSKKEFVSYLNAKYSEDYQMKDFIFEEDVITEYVYVSEKHSSSMEDTKQVAGYYVKDAIDENYIGYIAFEYAFIRDEGFEYKNCYFYDIFQADEIKEAIKSYIKEQVFRTSISDKIANYDISFYDVFENDYFFFSTTYNGDMGEFLVSENQIRRKLPTRSKHIIPVDTYLADICFYLVDDLKDSDAESLLEYEDCKMFADFIDQSIGVFGYVISTETLNIILYEDNPSVKADYLIYLDDTFVNLYIGSGSSSTKTVYYNPQYWIHFTGDLESVK